MTPVGIGLIGAGMIHRIYAENLRRIPGARLVAVADQDPARTEAAAAAWEARAVSVEALLADPAIHAVLNLTPPQAHAAVSQAIIAAGKHVYSEKPLAVTVPEAEALLAAAAARGVRVGCAPDTFLGAGIQTARKALDDGWIGTPLAGLALMLGHGPDTWHPHAEFFYAPGAGPLFDVGPYYLTALVTLLGPIRRVWGAARQSGPRRILAGPRAGDVIPVATPTHVAAQLEFAAGPLVTLVTSFDVWATETPRIEIYGSEGTLAVPDPNTFGGPVRVRRAQQDSWATLPLVHAWTENCRGLGLADLLAAEAQGRPHRAHGALALHVLEAMAGILHAHETGTWVTLTTTVERPAPLGPAPTWRDLT
ncbi:MAG: Gfo/Idh/MocA family oxidoreductase [Firmicutes bacterium]|nr:Gfo/Idh/MocA family oxidoreductase [Bacillota bacterium]